MKDIETIVDNRVFRIIGRLIKDGDLTMEKD